MSSLPPLSPKLQTLADFGGDLTGFLEHVEHYRQYTELREQMNKTKKNLLFQNPSEPSYLNIEVQADNIHSKPVSFLVAEPSPIDPAITSHESPSTTSLALLSKTISPAERQISKSKKLFKIAVNGSYGLHSNSMSTYDTSKEVVSKLTLPVPNKIISKYGHDFDNENKPLISHWKTLLKAQYGKVHKYACKACGKRR